MHRGLLIGYRGISDATGRLAFFAVVLLAARLLDPQSFGLFSLAYTAGWILSVAADFGLQLYLTREVARAPSQAAAIFARLVPVRIALAVGLLGAAAGVTLALESWRPWVPLLLILAVHFGNSLIDFFYGLFRGLSRSDLESTLHLFHRLLSLLLVGAFLVLYPSSLWGLALGLILGSLAGLGATLLVARQLLRRAGGKTEDVLSWEMPPASALFREVFPIGAGIVLSALYFRLDIFLIEWWRGVEAVALYSAVFRLVEALRLIPAAVLAVVFPELCRGRTWRPVLRTSLGLFVAAVGLASILGWNAFRLVELFFGEPYLSAAPVFRILLLALPLYFVNFALTHQLVAWNLQRFYLLLCGVALGVNLASNFMLIPALGIAGAAWAVLLTEGSLTLGCFLALARAAPLRGAGAVAAGDKAVHLSGGR